MMQGVSEPAVIVSDLAFFGSRDAPVSASYIAEQRTGDRTLKMTHAGSLPLIVPPAAWENNQVRADPLDAVERLLGRCDAGYFFQMGERVPARLGRTREVVPILGCKSSWVSRVGMTLTGNRRVSNPVAGQL